MALWVAVHGYANGESQDETVLNRPIFELTERTNYLYNQTQSLIGTGLYESVRLLNASLKTTGSDAPVVGDVVYLDPITKQYAKAIANTSTLDLFTASDSSYAVGLLITSQSGLGTIVLLGKAGLNTSGSAWLLSDLLESGEVFRNGPYYLSSVTAGKITAYPSGISIFIGNFTATAINPIYGDFALINPQYKNTGDAHVHRAYQVLGRPAGTQAVSGTLPTDTHIIHGFKPIMAPTGTDRMPNLIILGNWLGQDPVQYTFWLSTAAGTTRATSPAPTDFSDAYLHWESSDPVEGTGSTRIWSFETPVSVGTKGLTVLLENPDDTEWENIYEMDPGGSGDDPDKRSWILAMPDQAIGWLARHYRQYMDATAATGHDYSFIVIGGPHISSDNRAYDNFMVKCLEIHPMVYTGNPADGDTLTINLVTYEFDTDSTVGVGNIKVTIEAAADDTYINLLNAILAHTPATEDVALDLDNTRILLGTVAGGTVTLSGGFSNATLSATVAGAGVLTVAGGTADFMVYDRNHYALPDVVAGIWEDAEYWVPIALRNGLSILPIPYTAAGATATSPNVSIADYWLTEILDEAPGAYFHYNMGMHVDLNQFYPPIPRQAAALLVNGVEMDSADYFENPTYKLGNSTIYWYSNLYSTVPWPLDWVDINNPGSDEYQQKILLHFVRMAIGMANTVTSLRPAPNSPIRVLQCGTNEVGTVGDLALDLDLALVGEDAGLAGYNVFKSTNGNKLLRGPIVERIEAGDGISVTQAAGAPSGQGIVTISAGNSVYDGDFDEVALENAKQEMIGMFPYIRLLGWQTGSASNVPTGFVAKFRLPHTLTGQYRVIVYMTVFGEVTIPWVGGGSKKYAGIEFTYNVLPDFENLVGGPAWGTLKANVMSPASDVTADIPFGKYVNPKDPSYEIYDAYDPMLIHNNDAELPDVDRKIFKLLGNPFPNTTDIPTYPVVKKGDLVAIRVSRANISGGGPEYTSPVGFINLRWRLVRVI